MRRVLEETRRADEVDAIAGNTALTFGLCAQKDWSNLDILVFCDDPAQVLKDNGLAGHIELSKYRVKLGAQSIFGRAVGIIAMWRNPRSPNHYLAIVTSNDALHCELPNMNFAFEGWFDYMAWETTETQRTVVLEADRFDRNWN
jgi:hypothetical protein